LENDSGGLAIPRRRGDPSLAQQELLDHQVGENRESDYRLRDRTSGAV
jgi:hypothetical protein